MNLEPLALIHVHPLLRQWDRPTRSDWANVLATYPLFAGVSRRRLRKLANKATFAEFAPGETIIFAGDRDQSLYIVLGGDVKAVSTLARRVLGSGDYFGEVAMIDGRPRSATVVAISYAHVMKLPAPSVMKLARRHAGMTLNIVGDLTARLRHLETQAAARAA